MQSILQSDHEKEVVIKQKKKMGRVGGWDEFGEGARVWVRLDFNEFPVPGWPQNSLRSSDKRERDLYLVLVLIVLADGCGNEVERRKK